MVVTLNKLTAKQVKDAADKGRLADGGGLWLQVSGTGSKSWLFIYRWDGKRPELGLGPYPTVSLADARRRAEEARACLAEKPRRDPRVAFRRLEESDSGATVFGEFAEQFLNGILSDFRNAKHRQQWRNSIRTYAAPIWNKKLSEIETIDVLSVLQPIWNEKRETAKRVRGRIERILDAAKAKGLREGDNPARWRGHLSAILPDQRKPRVHHPAMPFVDVPEFMRTLRGREAMSARALEFLILTAARSAEAREARWTEVDLNERVWTIPAERMKAHKVHRVPLSEDAVQLLRKLHDVRQGSFVFPGTKAKSALSEAALRRLMARSSADQFTIHGFRSSFRDWAGECTRCPREIAEQALAHAVGNEAERAYRRGDALEKRRELMEAWSAFCADAATNKVVMLHV